MGIYARDLRELVIRPTLQQLDEWSPAAENLLLGTAAQESGLGFRMQANDAEGAGLYCLCANVHIQIWDEYLIGNPELASRMRGLASQHQFLKSPHHELITNLSYATGIAWMVYKRHNLKLPNETNLHELANCWLTCYSTRDVQTPQILCDTQQVKHGDSVVDNFITNYRKLILCENENQILAA